MNHESWIWTELLAFDNTQADLGVSDYLDRLGFAPTGVSLLASASDFIVLHEGLDEERPLYPDVCARFGQAGNEERQRQEWTNQQVRDLVSRLRAAGVQVFVSVFAAYHHDRFHREWLSDHPEARIVYSHLGVTDGVQMLARLADGTYYQDLFAGQLARVLLDYGFDGFHGPDCLGPAGSLSFNDCSDGIAAQFAEFLGADAPAELTDQRGWDEPALAARMAVINDRLYARWVEFNLLRWEQFWAAIVGAVKPLGKGTMINSANTKSAFESMHIFGMDYRRVARLGVDYLVVETVAANLALINGGYERHFDFAATLAEMKAHLPGMKLLFLHGVKDVCESYDLLRHAPSRLEREVYTLANQTRVTPDGLERCATGFMVCLGDGLAATEWAYLRRQWHTAWSATPTRAGELTWVYADSAVDALRHDYPARGTWPAFKQIAHLVEHEALQIHSICRVEDLAHATGPLIVPNADLLTSDERSAVAAYAGGPVVLLGHLANEGTYACRVLESGRTVAEVAMAPAAPWQPADAIPPLFFGDRPNHEALPAEFWTAAAEAIRAAVDNWSTAHGLAMVHAGNAIEGLRLLLHETGPGRLRLALVSTIDTYLVPDFTIVPAPAAVEKVSGFPYTPLNLSDGQVRTGLNFTPLHVPPHGIIVMDVTVAAQEASQGT